VNIVLTFAWGAQIVVYDAPFGGAGSFQAVFNAMINGGVSIISNSWTYCEDQTTSADVQSIDSILQTAAAAGISVLSATGDSGSRCWNGSANVAQVPTTAPHITAVGGTSPSVGQGFTYGSETWWDDSNQSPPGGQGGFGISRYFARPTYQNGFTTSGQRSIPDVSIGADPTQGFVICQAAAGGCPLPGHFAGTSASTPVLSAFVAHLNEAQGVNLGFLNPQFYALAATDAFHNSASMGTDFAHVGIGSPNGARLHQRLSNQTVGVPDPNASDVRSFASGGFFSSDPIGAPITIPADGATTAYVVVRLVDANGNIVAGKQVTLNPQPSGHVVITPPSGVSTNEDGAVVFAVKNLTAETVTFTAMDTTDNTPLAASAIVKFDVPVAASVSFVASPSVVPADGATASTLTLTLTDALQRPTPSKLILISQGTGHAIINGPSPAVTDASGQIQFTVTDNVGETVTFTAVDATDANLKVPITPTVTFTGGGSSCLGTPPQAGAGFALTTFANGFPAQNFFYSGVNWGGCPGATNPAFDASGNVFSGDFFNGKLYAFGSTGGAVSTTNVLATIGQTLNTTLFAPDGTLYVLQSATGSGSSSGRIVKVDPATGAILATLATGLTCPSPLSRDPLSGDLFFTDTCFGGSTNPSLFRLLGTTTASPSVVVYASLPTVANGPVAFAPNGTMYVVSAYNGAGNVIQVSGTNSGTVTQTTLSGINSDFWINLAEAQPNGAAKSLLVHNNNALKLVDITTTPFTTTTLATGALSTGSIGPDGCLYVSSSDSILKLTSAAGTCGFTPGNAGPALVLSPATIAQNPAQGTVQPFTAAFANASPGAGVPVTFVVMGPNAMTQLTRTDANGAATFSYVGRLSGEDTVLAVAPLPGQPSEQLFSNSTVVDWGSGKHVTALSLGTAPEGGLVHQPALLAAALIDVSVSPAAAIAGQTVQMTAGPWSCSAATDAGGVARCTIDPTSAGLYSLTATFAGNGSLNPATATKVFRVLGSVPLTLDVDQSDIATRYDALTDGLLVIRWLFGLTGAQLTSAALGTTATRTDPAVLQAYLDSIRTELDIDGNGTTDALTDGLLIIRYLFGLRGASLINGAIGPGATRTTSTAIETYIQSLMP
jgi:hypothetical protein